MGLRLLLWLDQKFLVHALVLCLLVQLLKHFSELLILRQILNLLREQPGGCPDRVPLWIEVLIDLEELRSPADYSAVPVILHNALIELLFS